MVTVAGKIRGTPQTFSRRESVIRSIFELDEVTFVMGRPEDKALQRLLRQAEGYLELSMPTHALRILRQIDQPDSHDFAFHLLNGMAHRDLQDYRQALVFLEAASRINSDSVTLQMGLAWCYKRTDQLPRAIEATEFAHHLNPQEPILMYNLACYLSLAGEKERALNWLGQALRASPSMAKMIPEESDFDPLRHDPDFVKMIDMTDSPKT